MSNPFTTNNRLGRQNRRDDDWRLNGSQMATATVLDSETLAALGYAQQIPEAHLTADAVPLRPDQVGDFPIAWGYNTAPVIPPLPAQYQYRYKSSQFVFDILYILEGSLDTELDSTTLKRVCIRIWNEIYEFYPINDMPIDITDEARHDRLREWFLEHGDTINQIIEYETDNSPPPMT